MKTPLFVKIACVAYHGNVYGIASPSGLAPHLKGSITKQCQVTSRKRRHVDPAIVMAGMQATRGLASIYS